MAEFETKFSGVKDNFATGATRDSAAGKGRYDLISPHMLRRLAGVYERGATNHGAVVQIDDPKFLPTLRSWCTCGNRVAIPHSHTTLAACVAAVTKKNSDGSIQTTPGGKEPTERSGAPATEPGSTTSRENIATPQPSERGNGSALGREPSRISASLSTTSEPSANSRTTAAQYAEARPASAPSISTTITPPWSRVDSSVEPATRGSDSFETIQSEFVRHSPTCSIHHSVAFEVDGDRVVGRFTGDRNWEKGIPYTRLCNSAIRHILQGLSGLTDEDHFAQAVWNLTCIIHFQEEGRVELDNLPRLTFRGAKVKPDGIGVPA